MALPRDKSEGTMEIDFKNIRPLQGDRRLGFEEFCCQMAEIDVERETGSPYTPYNFHRKEGKGGDAGVECYYVLPDGSEWGWQAKYFMNGVGQAQWKQIDESVQKALAGHPRLVRYTVCLPVDLSDSKVPKKKSEMDYWRDYKAKWTEQARQAERNTTFLLWRAYHLRKQLLEVGDRGAGFILYWFDEKILTNEWLLARFDEAEKDAGPRYTPELHVHLPLCSHFEAFCRTGSFLETLAGHYDQLLRKWKQATRWPEIHDTEQLAEAATLLGQQIERLALELDRARQEAFRRLDFDKVLTLASEAMTLNSRCIDLAEQARRQKPESYQSSRYSQSAVEHYLSELQSSLAEIDSFSRSREARLAERRAVLLSGEAGTGKTHLFCDLAKKRIADGLPTVVLLGQKFSPETTPWSQIVDHLHLGRMEPERFLGALDAAAWVSGKRAIILIDALNEGAGAELWNTHLAGMLATLSNFPRIVLAVSCRESYVDDVVPENLLKNDEMYRLRHQGFEGHEFDATRSFFAHYGIQTLAEPLLVPEFSNPLFLKLLCQGLANEGKKQVPKGLKGITNLFQFFIDSVNRKLSKKLGMDQKDEIVRQVVDALAGLMAEKQQSWLDRNEVKALIHKVRPEPQEYERTLFRNLIHEGVLRGDKFRVALQGARIEAVSFAYDRLADHLVVFRWLKAATGLTNPKEILEALPVAKRMANDEAFARRHAGWIEALSVQIPEQLGKELVQVAPRLRKSATARRAFLVSLLWRQPDRIGKGAFRFLNNIMGYCTKAEFESAMEVLLMVSCDPDHPLNARRLHKWLLGFCMGDRDHVWSIFLHEQYEWNEDGPVHRLIDWAWNADKSNADDQVIELCATLLAWFLTSSHRFLRDRTTKALVAMLRDRPRVLLRVLERFQGLDDPYVMERLYAVAYGVAMTTDDDGALSELAKRVYKRVFAADSTKPHILLRDYARGVIEIAARRGVLSSGVDRDLTTPPYRTEWPITIPKESELAAFGEWPSDRANRNDPRWSSARLYHWIMDTLHGPNDFVICELRPKCDRFAHVTPEALGVDDLHFEDSKSTRVIWDRFDVRLAQRWIMNRVLELGWTTDWFGEFDEQVQQGVPYHRMDVSKPERIGKKYAWIGMHEFLGYLSDHVDYRGDNWREEPSVYSGPWQIGLRDIDPSLLVKSTWRTERSEAVQCWWQPVEYQFKAQSGDDFKQRIMDLADQFDPLDLIHIVDPDGSKWLALEGFYNWTDEAPLGEDPHEIPRRNLWLMLKSYIVKRGHAAAVIRRINERGLWGRWMPESKDIHEVFLGEYPWAPAFALHEGAQGWTNGYGRELPHPVAVTAMKYLCESGGYDCSIMDTVSACLPSPWLVNGMGLSWSRKGFSFVDGNGRVVTCDPSEKEIGPSALLICRDALTTFLSENNYEIIWTVLGERWVIHPAFGSTSPRNEGHAVLQSTYRLRNGKVIGGPLKKEFGR